MTGITLRLDVERWREHLRVVAGATPGLVAVAKGNGYGFGLRRLAEESERLGVDTLAVGAVPEVEQVREAFSGDIVVLTPFDRADERARLLVGDPRVITTVSRIEDLEYVAGLAAGPRVVVEVLTSMRRHGILPDQLARVSPLLARVDFCGWTIHLPLRTEGRYAEAERLARTALDVAPGPLWLSHLPAEEAEALSRQLAGAGADPVPLRLRVGTRLWLDHSGARQTTATVLDVHPVRRGERTGYRQRVSPMDGWVAVVAGGTSHGIGLEAPTAATTLRSRAISLATGSLEAAGLALSPYSIGGRARWFVEPPHMQCSLVFLPRRVTPPQVGDEVPVRLRLTTATVDQVVDV
ncbi:MAG TPA: alanine racemase [Propionibacteriaceae bacterium]|nr:alanine racemase [Propionibacteriaceae bacterium]